MKKHQKIFLCIIIFIVIGVPAFYELTKTISPQPHIQDTKIVQELVSQTIKLGKSTVINNSDIDVTTTTLIVPGKSEKIELSFVYAKEKERLPFGGFFIKTTQNGLVKKYQVEDGICIKIIEITNDQQKLIYSTPSRASDKNPISMDKKIEYENEFYQIVNTAMNSIKAGQYESK